MSETHAARRKRLLYQSRYRGFLESDLVMGRFAECHLPALSEQQVDRYEKLLAENDHDLYGWVTRAQSVPARHDHDVMAMLQDFSGASGERGLRDWS